MEKGEGLALAVVAGCALFVGGWILLPQHGIFREPHSWTKTMAVVAVVLFALAAPFAVAEARSDRRFRLAREALARERAWSRVAPYEGSFGCGVAFEAEDRRVLLLHPAGGLGAPFVVEETLPPPQPPEQGAHGVEIPVLADPERA